MMQAARAVGVTLCSMGAAALAAGCVSALADRDWLTALWAAALVFLCAAGACSLFRQYVKHSPRHGGRS